MPGEGQNQRAGSHSNLVQAGGDVRIGMSAAEARQYIDDALAARLSSDGGGLPPPSSMPGWLRLTSAYLAGQKFRDDLGAYFDGASPDWKDICNPQLKRRKAVDAIEQTYSESVLTDRSILTLILGASGEGKSTVLMQAARAIVDASRFDAVYWRTSPQVELSESVIAGLVASFTSVLVVADDAESLLEDIDRFAQWSLHDSGVHVHFLLASRDTDWIAEQNRLGWRLSVDTRWGKALSVMPRCRLDSVDPADARIIVDNWVSCSAVRPERVEGLTPGEMAQALLTAARASQGRQALLGALLEVRLGASELKHRLGSLIEVAQESRPNDNLTLADLLVLLAVIDVCDLPGLPRDVTAETLGVEEGALRALVEVPLRREFAFGATSRAFFSRHPSISEAILELVLGEESTVRVDHALSGLLRAVRSVMSTSVPRRGLGQLVDVGRRLMQSEIDQRLIADTALATCREARRVFPEALSNHIALSQTLRDLGEPDTAIREVWSEIVPKLDDASGWSDYVDHLRGTWTDMSASLGLAGSHGGAFWAAAASVSDRCTTSLASINLVVPLNLLALNASQVCQAVGGRPELKELVAEIAAVTGGLGSALYDDRAVALNCARELRVAPRANGGGTSLVRAILAAGSALPPEEDLPGVLLVALQDPRNASFESLTAAVPERAGPT